MDLNNIKFLNNTNLLILLKNNGLTDIALILENRNINGKQFLELSEIDLVRWGLSIHQKKLLLECKNKIIQNPSKMISNKPPIPQRNMKPATMTRNGNIKEKLETLLDSKKNISLWDSKKKIGIQIDNLNFQADKLYKTASDSPTKKVFRPLPPVPIENSPKGHEYMEMSRSHSTENIEVLDEYVALKPQDNETYRNISKIGKNPYDDPIKKKSNPCPMPSSFQRYSPPPINQILNATNFETDEHIAIQNNHHLDTVPQEPAISKKPFVPSEKIILKQKLHKPVDILSTFEDHNLSDYLNTTKKSTKPQTLCQQEQSPSNNSYVKNRPAIPLLLNMDLSDKIPLQNGHPQMKAKSFFPPSVGYDSQYSQSKNNLSATSPSMLLSNDPLDDDLYEADPKISLPPSPLKYLERFTLQENKVNISVSPTRTRKISAGSMTLKNRPLPSIPTEKSSNKNAFNTERILKKNKETFKKDAVKRNNIPKIIEPSSNIDKRTAENVSTLKTKQYKCKSKDANEDTIWNFKMMGNLPKPPQFKSTYQNQHIEVLAKSLENLCCSLSNESSSDEEEFNPNNFRHFRHTDRKGSKILLKQFENGAFLFRPSTSHFLVLTVIHENEFYNLGIERDLEENFICKSASDTCVPKFRMLYHLVRYYTKNPLTLKNKDGSVTELYLKDALPDDLF